ncbi:ABC transporter ATP-binding protein [Lacunimicrobium album]
MDAVVVEHLQRSFRVNRQKEGFWAKLRGLIKRESETIHAVKDVSFRIEKGEMVGFLGPNGAGKTTTLKLLSGLLMPTAGKATVLGYEPWKRENAYRRRFSLLMGQKNQLWWDLPAQESFRLHKEIYRIETKRYQDRMDELTDLLEIRKQLSQPVRELSLGQRMRMELIAALLHDPEILFLDEPTIGLDVISQNKVQQFLKYYQEHKQITVLLTSHYMKDVEALCKRVIIIDEGIIKHDGLLTDVLSQLNPQKVVTLKFSEHVESTQLSEYGDIIEQSPMTVKIRLGKADIPGVLSYALAEYPVEDVSVQDRPIEELFAELFSRRQSTEEEARAAVASM